MLFKKNDKPRFLVPVCLVLAMTLLLGACGEDEKQAAAAVQWLSAYTKDYPPNKEWIATNIAVDDNGRVVMDVVVPDQGQVDLIKSRTRVEQFHIVRMACPPKEAEVWTILSASQELWINLLEKTPGGLFKPMTGAVCLR